MMAGFPSRGIEIIDGLLSRPENRDLAQGTDDQRRVLTRMIAEQLRYELGTSWGTKARSAGAPQSKDALAQDIGNGRMDVWDWQNGATRARLIMAGSDPTYPNLEGAFFVVVDATDHLHIEAPQVETPPATAPNGPLAPTGRPSAGDVSQLAHLIANVVTLALAAIDSSAAVDAATLSFIEDVRGSLGRIEQRQKAQLAAAGMPDVA